MIFTLHGSCKMIVKNPTRKKKEVVNSTIRKKNHIIALSMFAFLHVLFFSSLSSWPRYIIIIWHTEHLNNVNAVICLCWAHFLFAHLCVPEHTTGSNRFCEDWMHAFVNGAEGGNPFLFRQILENFKLKVTVCIC